MYFWLSDNYIEIFGAITGIIYVFLEIRQTIWLWPLGIITSGVYVWVFFSGKLYADMSLQAYYVFISAMGWYWWMDRRARRRRGEKEMGRLGKSEKGVNGEILENERSTFTENDSKAELVVTRLKQKTGLILSGIFVVLYFIMWFLLSRYTDSPVPEWDSFLTSLSIIATWMLARKIYEHWLIWIVVNLLSVVLYFSRELYPTVILYLVYAVMSFAGLAAWKKTIPVKQIR
jgi:nicotinamide mononucleotide transporter